MTTDSIMAGIDPRILIKDLETKLKEACTRAETLELVMHDLMEEKGLGRVPSDPDLKAFLDKSKALDAIEVP